MTPQDKLKKLIQFKDNPALSTQSELLDINEKLTEITTELKKEPPIVNGIELIKGEPGETPEFGVDYWTSEQIEEVKAELRDEVTPVKGADYFDGEPGKDGKHGLNGKDGRDGRDGQPGIPGKDGRDGIDGENPDPEEVVEYIKNLKGNDRIDISSIRNAEQLIYGKGKKGIDQRYHGAGVTKIIAGTGITISSGSPAANGLGDVTITSTGGSNFADNETPVGIINGTNKVFTLANTPIAGSEHIFLNGARQQSGGGDYSIVTTTITFVIAPPSTSVLIADYRF